MGILSGVTDFLVSGAGGGLLGLLGSGVNRFMAFKERAQKHEHDLALAEIETNKDNRRHAHEVALHKMNLEQSRAETEREVLVAREAGSWKAFEASHKTAATEAENFNGSEGVENYRATTRPNLTYLLWLIVLIAFFFVDSDARLQIIAAAIFCATASTTWWFGDRAPKYKNLALVGPV